jgi:hypothetical protein
MRTTARQRWLVALGVAIAVAALGAVTYRGVHLHDAPPVLGDGTYGIPQDQPLAPPPGDTRPKVGPEETSVVRAILATDPVLDQIGVSEAQTASRHAVVHAMGGTLYSATIPLKGHRHFDSAVPAWVGPAFGVDPPEVRQARLVADEVTALIAWVDVERRRIVQIETDGSPVLYRWIGKPPPVVPGD